MAGKYDLYIDQGSTFVRTFEYQDASGDALDVTGYTAQMMVRRSLNAGGDPTLDTDDHVASLQVTDGPAGKFTLSLTDDITAALPAPFEGVYDIEINDGSGTITRLVEGKVFISPNVTRG